MEEVPDDLQLKTWPAVMEEVLDMLQWKSIWTSAMEERLDHL